jgi:choline dehydrogenase-like flavoprotein
MSSPPIYDFIIVGGPYLTHLNPNTPSPANLLLGGTSGCVLAHYLSTTPSRPRILLLEAGATPSGAYLRAPFHRFAPAFLRPDLDHGYVSEPEAYLNNRTINYTRGKGLGGSSILNFGVYLYGAKDDYDTWAEETGDAEWGWESVKQAFHDIETYDVGSGYGGLADASTAGHGKTGLLKVGVPPMLETGVEQQMRALVNAGEKVCLDPNNGDPVGIFVMPYSYSKEGRNTSALAFLKDASENLEIWTGAKAERLVWEGKRVVGVVLEDGRKGTHSCLQLLIEWWTY